MAEVNPTAPAPVAPPAPTNVFEGQQDVTKFNLEQNSVGQKIADMVAANPALKHQPATVFGLSNVESVDGKTLGLAAKHMTTFKAVGNTVDPSTPTTTTPMVQGVDTTTTKQPGQKIPSKVPASGATSTTLFSVSGNTPAPSGPVVQNTYNGSNIFHSVANEFDAFRHETANLADAFGQGTVPIAKSIWDFVHRTGVTIEELATVGNAGYSNSQSKNLADAFETLWHTATYLPNTVNPWSQQNLLFSMQHMGAYLLTMSKQKGWAYTISYMMPTILAAIAAKNAAVGSLGVEAIDSAAVDATTIKDLEAKATSGTINDAERNLLDKAKMRTQERADTPKRENVTQKFINDMHDVSSPIRRGMAGVTNVAGWRGPLRLIGIPVRTAMKILHAATAPGRDLSNNIAYLIAQQNAQTDPFHKALWEATKGGNVFDANGNRIGTDGEAFAQFLGAHQGDMWFAPIQKSVDFYTKWLGSDPFGAVGKVTAAARTSQGLGGMLGKWFDGTGIKEGSDIWRVADKYNRAARTFEWQASHDEGQILRKFTNTYTVDQARLLGKAKTVDAVKSLHAEWADANALLKPEAPLMSVWDLAKANIKEGKFAGIGFAGDGGILGRGIDFLRANRAEILKDTAYDVAPKDATEAIVQDVNEQMQTIKARWFKNIFNKSPMWRDETSLKLQTEKITPGSANAISDGIARWGQSIGISETEINQVTKDLMATGTDTEAYKNVFENFLVRFGVSGVLAGMEKNFVSALRNDVIQMVRINVRHFTAGDYGAETATFTQGAEATNYGSVIDAEKNQAIGAGLDEQDLGSVYLPRRASMEGMVRDIRQAIQSQTASTTVMASESTRLFLDQFKKLANYSNATMAGVDKEIAALAGTKEIPVMAPRGLKAKEMATGYATGVEQVRNEIRGYVQQITENRDLPNVPYPKNYEVFTAAFTPVQNTIRTLKILLNLSDEKVMNNLALDAEGMSPALEQINGLIPPNPWVKDALALSPENTAYLRGMLHAYEDSANIFTNRLNTVNMSTKDLDTHFDEYVTSLNKTQELDKNLTEALKKRTVEIRKGNSNYLNNWYKFGDMVNHIQSNYWVQLALATGKWAAHIVASESMLNYLRLGFRGGFESSVMRSAIRHEIGYTEVAGMNERSLINRLQKKIDDIKYPKPAESEIVNPSNVGLHEPGTDLKNIENGLAHNVESGKSIHGVSFNDPEFHTTEVGLLGKATAMALSGINEIFLKLPRDIVGGAVLGFDRTLLSGMKGLQYERLLDNTVRAMIDFKGHLPGGVEGHNGGIFENDFLDYTAKRATVGYDKSGKLKVSHLYPSSKYTAFNKGEGYVTALYSAIAKLGRSDMKRATVQRLADIMHEEGTKILLSEGKTAEQIANMTLGDVRKKAEKSFSSEGDFKRLIDELTIAGYKHISSLPDNVLARYRRNELRLAQNFQCTIPGLDNARGDWAKAIAHDVFGVVGSRTGEEGNLIHHSLVDQVVHGEAKYPTELAKDINKMPKGTEPVNIQARQMVPYKDLGGSLGKLKDGNFLSWLADKGHEKIFGPIINNMVREPVFLLEYHYAYESMRDAVDRGLISEDAARTKAAIHATENMTRFVHNPLDRTVAEKNIKAAAPFYFAQNQAWRRALRVLQKDPGAFEKFMKIQLGITNHVSVANDKGQPITVTLPGSQWIGDVLSLIGFPTRGMGITTSLSHVGSMDVLGSSMNPVSMIAGIFRPSFGPAVTVPVDGLNHLMGLVHFTWVQNIINWLAPDAVKYGLGSQLQPSPILSDLYGAIRGDQSGLASSVNNSLREHFVTDFQKKVAEVESNPQYLAIIESLPADKQWAYITGTAGYLQSVDFKDTNKQTAFISAAHGSGTTMAVLKALLGDVFNPGTSKIRDMLSKAPEFQTMYSKMAPLKNADGSNTYSYWDIVSQYTQEHPEWLLYTAAISGPTGVSFPETKSFFNMATNHPEFIAAHPSASAYLLDRSGQTDNRSWALQIKLGLRQTSAPQNVVNNLLIADGEAYVNGVLKTKYPNYQIYNSPDYKNYTAEINAYMPTNKPWWNYKQHSDSTVLESRAIEEFNNMFGFNGQPPENVPDSLFGGTAAKQIWANILTNYNNEARLLSNIPKYEAKKLKSTFYDRVQKDAETNPVYNNAQKYFLLNVVRFMPTVVIN